MSTVPFDIEINGKHQTLQIETDPAWGEIQRLIANAHVPDGKGGQKLDMMGFIDKLLEIVVLSSDGDFNIKNRTFVKSLPTSVMTKLIGGVTKLIPLQSYLDNMGDLANVSSQQ